MHATGVIALLAGTLVSLHSARAGFDVHPDPQVVMVKRPEAVEAFLDGDPGIVKRSYAWLYLAVAYHQLSGTTLSPEARAAALALVNERLPKVLPETVSASLPRRPVDVTIAPTDAPDSVCAGWSHTASEASWKEAVRRDYPDLAAGLEIQRFAQPEGESLSLFINCTEGTFGLALATLRARETSFGKGNEAVRAWLRSQIGALQQCGQPAAATALPPLGLARAPRWLRLDRRYHRAQAAFYSGSYGSAAGAFGRVSRNRASPWRGLALLGTARSFVRKASFEKHAGVRERLLARAERVLRPQAVKGHSRIHRRLNAGKKQGGVCRRIVTDYRRLIRERRWAFVATLSGALVRTGDPGEILNELRAATAALTLLTDTVGVFEPQTEERIVRERFGQLVEVARDDATRWMITLKAGGAAAFTYARERYAETPSIPWYIAILALGQENPEAALDTDSPELTPGALTTVEFYRARLIDRTGNPRDAQRVREALLARADRGAALTQSDRNLIENDLMVHAQSMEEFLRYSGRPRVPTDTEPQRDPSDPLPPGRPLDSVGTYVMNRYLSLAILGDMLAARPPRKAAEAMASAAFARALYLNDFTTVQDLFQLSHTLPPVARDALEPLEGIAGASPPRRQFLRWFTLLRLPGLEPYPANENPRRGPPDEVLWWKLGPNWYCGIWDYDKKQLLPEKAATIPHIDQYLTADPPAAPPFLTPEQILAAESEQRRFAAVDSITHAAPKAIRDWVEGHPEDPLAPEALYLLSVLQKGAMESCHGSDELDQETLEWAETTLKDHYAESPWAKRE